MHDIEKYFLDIQKSELGKAINKDAYIKVLLVSPDSYDALALNLGIQMVAHSINHSKLDVIAHRSFCPEEIDKELGVRSIESLQEPKEYDIIGFSISNPLQIIKVYDWLSRANINIFVSERTSDDPLIIFGGMGCSNPEPFANIADVFFMGEAVKTIISFIQLYQDVKKCKNSALKKAAFLDSLYVPSCYETKIVNNRTSVVIPKYPEIPENIRPMYHFDMSNFLTATYRAKKDLAAILIDKGCLYTCAYCQYSYGTGGHFTEISLNQIIKCLDRLKEEGHQQVRIYSATATLHRDMQNILEACYDRDFRVIISPSRIDKLLTQDFLLEAIAKQNNYLVIPVDAPSEQQRSLVGRGKITNNVILEVVKKAYNYGVGNFSIFLIINYPNETRRQRKEFISLIQRIFDFANDIRLLIYINPLFPQPNTPLEKAEMKHPGSTFSIIDEMLTEMRQYANLYEDYLEITKDNPNHDSPMRMNIGKEKCAVLVRATPHVDQWLEGVTLRGDRRVGEYLYKLYRMNAFDGNSCSTGLTTITQLADQIGFRHEQYFEAFANSDPLPWMHVRPGSAALKNLNAIQKNIIIRLDDITK